MTWQGPAFTPVSITPAAQRIHYGDTIVLLGSCFTEHIGERLHLLKYTVNQNPFGILYNPVSLANALHRIIHQSRYTTAELVAHDGMYHSMDHHGSFSGPDPLRVIEHINASLVQANADLRKAKFVFISPGTSVVYRYAATDAVCGNCHKIPQSVFTRYRLSAADCAASFLSMRDAIASFTPGAQVIWTISPVRHRSEGLIQNQLSKALLFTSLAEVQRSFPGDLYFPAYEIMMDQLRDYRYYATDMIHPSVEAIEIIWHAFREMLMDDNELPVQHAIERIQRAMTHRFLHDEPEAKRKFATAHIALIDDLAHSKPNLSFEKERAYFESLLSL